MAELVIRVTKSASRIVFEALPTDDPQVRQPDIALAREILGWEPEVELLEGLNRTLGQSSVEALIGGEPAAPQRRRAAAGLVGSSERPVVRILRPQEHQFNHA